MSVLYSEESLNLLQRASTAFGFVASVTQITNYQRIWTRDGVITGLAALLSGDEALIRTFRSTLKTIFDHQHPVGFFPSNVDPQTGKASYGGNCGRVDNVSLALTGLMQYTLMSGDTRLVANYRTQVGKAFSLMDAWEFNGKHLLYVPQSGNWADEYVQHGYVLYDQLLRVWALRLAGDYYKRSDWQEKAAAVSAVIGRNYWNTTSGHQSLYAPNLTHQLKNAPDQYWLMGFNPARVYTQFDLAANALALLLNAGNASQNGTLISYLREQVRGQAFLLPAFSPAIGYDDFLMHELESNYAYQFRNLPHEFHNGGLWPVWNGWLAAALYAHGEHETGTAMINFLSEANQLNTDGEEWGFYENFHGVTHRPIGVQYCTWSAAGLIIAEAYRQNLRLAV